VCSPHLSFPFVQTLDLTANRLKHLEPNLLALPNLTWLSLRQNLISDPTEVEALSSGASLRHLELRDNQFTAAPTITNFTSLTYLELSYNEIRSLEPLAELQAPEMKQLYAAQNKISDIKGVSQLTTLNILELGSNRIRVIEGVDTLTNLKELWLGRNRIAEISGLDNLINLQKISLQSNRLTSTLNLGNCTALEELYLSHNGIEELQVRMNESQAVSSLCRRANWLTTTSFFLQGLESLINLKILDISNNRIKSLKGIETLTNLTDLWANDNAVESMDEIEAVLKEMAKTLEIVYLRGNPCASHEKYKLRMLYLLPKLEQLDDNPVKR